MATLQQALTRIDAICPNAWDDAAKIQWLNECEHMIQMRILDAAPEQCVTYDADTERGTVLLVPAPFDRLYVYYVIAMCDYAAHETAHYADSMALFNAALDEYAKWHQRTNGAAVPSPGQSHQIAMNSAMRHRHANKAVLDGITAERAAAWDQKSGQAEATPAAAGLMSAADKKKLDGMAQQTRIIHVGGDLSGTTADMTPAELYAYVSANPTHRVYAQLSFQGEHFLMLYQGATNGILTFSSLVADSERHTFCAVKLQAKTTGDVWDVPVRIELMTQNTVPATCGADGHIDTVCANCGDVIATEVIPATGAHTWDNGTVTTEPTETTPGVRTFTCAVCSQTKTEVIPATGAHTFVFTKNVAPSCTEAGYDLYTCRDCGATEKRNSKPALGHKWDSGTVTAEPTEKDPGTMTYTCTVCGATKTEVIPATGPHTHVWDEGTVTVAPTETTPGVRTYTCTVCGQTRTEIIPATGSAVCPGGAACPSFRFRDVPAPSNWAHEGIDYCVRHGLMSGFDATTFSPDTVSTRAQIVMILYNLSGDTTDYSKYYVPFTDVMPGTWYYNAVAWGYDKDIVSGMSATTFAPDGLITREQMAVLLYGYTEKYAPAYLGGAASLNGFPDAASVSNWAYAAMSWAVGNGLISGIASNGADYLAPSGGATRAQIAAIMMRYCRLTGL